MSNKTPYEIRAEVLEMAKDLAMQQYFANRENQMERWRVAADNNRDIPDLPELPEFPTEEAVVSKAQLLVEFVNGHLKPTK
jgi:hypothetical protein